MTEEHGQTIISLEGLAKSRGTTYRLEIPQMEVRAGDRIMLLGDSGSGKSTTLDLLALVLKPDDGGRFVWRPGGLDLDLNQMWRGGRADDLGRLRLADLGYVLQTGGLLPFLNVRDNILLPAELKKMPAPDRQRRLEELFEVLKIGHLAQKYPGQISVGERQRTAIARAVVHEPALILADEPTASLDPPTADRVFDLLLDLSRRSALVVATHDRQRARRHGFEVFEIHFPPERPGTAVLKGQSEGGPLCSV